MKTVFAVLFLLLSFQTAPCSGRALVVKTEPEVVISYSSKNFKSFYCGPCGTVFASRYGAGADHQVMIFDSGHFVTRPMTCTELFDWAREQKEAGR